MTRPLASAAPARSRIADRFALAIALSAAIAALFPAPTAAQETQIRGFADVTWSAASKRREEHASFALGQLDLFVTSKLAERIAFLAETVFEFDEHDFIADVERVIVSYSPSPLLNVAVGKHHTPIGYWNTAYHHGAVLQPTIERPTLFDFEDEGGVLPVHTTGITVYGRDVTPLRLGYDVMVGNGAGTPPTGDDNGPKSYTLALHSQVTSVLRVGASLYSDRLPAGSETPAGGTLDTTATLRTVGGYVALLGSTSELIAEYQRITGDVDGADSRGGDAAYVYAGRRIRSIVPYARYDWVRVPATDAYFPPGTLRSVLVGVRADVAPTAGVKLELDRRRVGKDPATTGVTVQVAIGF